MRRNLFWLNDDQWSGIEPYEERVKLDDRYAREWSLMLDVRILLRTLPVVLKARGSY